MGAWTGGATGSGSETVGILSQDTANVVAVQSVRVTVINTATRVVQGIPQYSNAAGHTDWLLDPADYEIWSFLGMNYFDIDTITVTADDTIQVSGYAVALPTAPGTHTCAFSVVVYDGEGQPDSGVVVKAFLSQRNLIDSSGYAVTTNEVWGTTNGSGIATLNLRASSWLIPATDWRIVIQTGAMRGVTFRYSVPDQASYLMDLKDR